MKVHFGSDDATFAKVQDTQLMMKVNLVSDNTKFAMTDELGMKVHFVSDDAMMN